MKKNRRNVTMTITVSGPRHMTPGAIRKEIKTRIRDLCHYDYDGEEVRLARPAKNRRTK